MRRILLIMIGASMLLYSAFSRDGGSGVVTDSVTGLIWQDNETVERTWVEAISYCESLTLEGNIDWRLPNIKELLSIVDYSTSNPAISSVFQNTIISYPFRYWSSTTHDGTEYARSVLFYYGYTVGHSKSLSNYVRCVTSGQ